MKGYKVPTALIEEKRRKAKDLLSMGMIRRNYANGMYDVLEEIKSLAEEELDDERKKGKWLYKPQDYADGVYECSVCGEPYWLDDEPTCHNYHYCPNCGAKMDGVVLPAIDEED